MHNISIPSEWKRKTSKKEKKKWRNWKALHVFAIFSRYAVNKRLCQEDCKDIDMVLIIKINLEDFRIITDHGNIKC